MINPLTRVAMRTCLTEEDEDCESSDFSESSDDMKCHTGLTRTKTDSCTSPRCTQLLPTQRRSLAVDSGPYQRAYLEGIVAQVLDYDYAPSSMSIETRGATSICQEGRSDVDFLREEELSNGSSCSKTFQPVTCYQISEKGAELTASWQVRSAGCAGNGVCSWHKDLLQVAWDGATLVAGRWLRKVNCY